MGDLQNLSAPEKTEIATVLLEFRQAGILGIIELRNFVVALFPEFAQFRDEDVDRLIENFAKSPSFPSTFEEVASPNQN